jgi:hypothetical protein
VIVWAALCKAGVQLLKDDPNSQGAEVRFAIAQTFYDEGRLDEAIEYLSAVAVEFPLKKQGGSAMELVLDAYKQNSI